MAVKVPDIKNKLALMDAERTGFVAHWQELIDLIGFNFFQDIVSQGTPGAKRGSKVCDSTASLAAVDLANGLYGTMTNPAIPWFAEKTENDALMENGEVKSWLQWLERQDYNLFNHSNFYSAIYQVYLSLGILGSGPVFIGEHFSTLAYFEPLNLGECYVAADQYGKLDTFYRCFPMTAGQMAQRWGLETLSERAQKAYKDNKITEKFTVIHAVEPRPNRDPERWDNRSFRWASVYLEKEAEDVILEEGGYREFPYCLPCFYTAGNELFGRGPGMLALPEVKELQQMKIDYSEGVQLRNKPPVLLPHDDFLGPVYRIPGGILRYRSDGNPARDRVAAFPVGGDSAYPDKEVERKQNFIRQIFFNQLFEVIQDPKATLGQVLLSHQKDMERDESMQVN